MLTGKQLGEAVRQAIELKLKSGKAKTKTEIAKHFRVRLPSIYDWIEKGSIDKSHLPEIWRYFSDVVGPEHWGMDELPPYASLPADQVELLELFDQLLDDQQQSLLAQARQMAAHNAALLRKLKDKQRP